MKLILTEKECNKNYQAKIIYESIIEIKKFETIIKKFKNKLLLLPFQETTKKENNNSHNTIEVFSIPKEILKDFINLFLSQKNATLVVANKEFNSNNIEDIEDIIDLLRITITIKKGKYFNIQDTYYATFKYVTDSQRGIVSYDFNNNLSDIMGHDSNINNENYLFPFIIDRNGAITFQNTGIIGGTNIPEKALMFFIRRVINEYNAVIIINNIKFRNLTNTNNLLQALSSLNTNKTKIKKDA